MSDEKEEFPVLFCEVDGDMCDVKLTCKCTTCRANRAFESLWCEAAGLRSRLARALGMIKVP